MRQVNERKHARHDKKSIKYPKNGTSYDTWYVKTIVHFLSHNNKRVESFLSRFF